MISSIIHSVIIIHVTYSISEMPYQWTSSCPCLLISAPSHARVCARLQLPPDRSELRAGFQRRGQHDFPAPPQPCLAQKPVESSRWCLLATTLRGTTASGTSLSAHQPPAPLAFNLPASFATYQPRKVVICDMLHGYLTPAACICICIWAYK